MIYPHQQKAIAYIKGKFEPNPQVLALLICGSISHGFNNEGSDVDINIIVSDEAYEQKSKEQALIYWESAESFYPGGYFDGKYIALNYLSLVAERGNEPTRFALHDAQIAFDRTGQVASLLQKIGTYPLEGLQEKTTRLLAQLDAWKWYCDEALKRNDPYLLDVSVSKLILFAGRLVLLENRLFFPYHKWFIKALEKADNKPSELMPAIDRVLKDKSAENIATLHDLVKGFRDWSGGLPYRWPFHFLRDTETVWMRQEEFVENM